MKIALIDPVGGHGGMDYYDYGLAYGLKENELEVLYFTCNETKELIGGVAERFDVFGNIWKKSKLKKLLLWFYGYFKAFRLSKEKGAKVVHFQFFHLGVQNVLVLLLGKLFGLKLVVTLHDIHSFRENEVGFVKKVGFSLISTLIVHNQFSYDELRKLVKRRNIEVIPHGNYLPFLEVLNQKEVTSPLQVLFFGQIKKVKGLELLLEAVSKINKKERRVFLTIAGRPWGTEESTYYNKIEELNLQNSTAVHFRYIPNDEVVDFFKNADLVVLPYKQIYQSGVLLMAMSYGRLTLCSNLPAFSEIIEHNKNGFLFESENVEDLVNQIENILNKSDLSLLSENAIYDLKTKFDWQQIGAKTKEVYNHLITKH